MLRFVKLLYETPLADFNYPDFTGKGPQQFLNFLEGFGRELGAQVFIAQSSDWPKTVMLISICCS